MDAKSTVGRPYLEGICEWLTFTVEPRNVEFASDRMVRKPPSRTNLKTQDTNWQTTGFHIRSP